MSVTMPDGLDVDILVKEPAWEQVLEEQEPLTMSAIGAALSQLSAPKIGELSVALINDAEMQDLNKAYRGKDRPTNVLSFPDEGPAPLLGDIVVALETVQREAKEKSISLSDHFVHMIIHGFLHLQGYDHIDPDEAEHMERLEIAALASMEIDNPYVI